jgi:hypothetical protein
VEEGLFEAVEVLGERGVLRLNARISGLITCDNEQSNCNNAVN